MTSIMPLFAVLANDVIGIHADARRGALAVFASAGYGRFGGGGNQRKNFVEDESSNRDNHKGPQASTNRNKSARIFAS